MVMQRGLVTELLLCKICADADKPAKAGCRLKARPTYPFHTFRNARE
jgi:hypothetical protein